MNNLLWRINFCYRKDLLEVLTEMGDYWTTNQSDNLEELIDNLFNGE